MPLSPSEAQVINTSMQVSSNMGTNYTNNRLTREQNKIDRDREDYWNYQQRKWANEDWERTAQYNSPAQQMQRFKEAGLNPNLIYGKASEMPMIKTPTPSASRGSTPQISNPLQNINVAQAYYSAKMMEKQIKLLDLEISSKAIENEDKMVNMDRNKMDLAADVGDGTDMNLRQQARRNKYYGEEIEKQTDLLKMQILEETKTFKVEQDYLNMVLKQKAEARTDLEKEYLQSKIEILKDRFSPLPFALIPYSNNPVLP